MSIRSPTYQQRRIFCAIAVTNISESFYLKDGGTGIDMEQNYVTVTLCIPSYTFV